MNFSLVMVLISIPVFAMVTFILLRSTYRHYEKRSGKMLWRLEGSTINYLCILVLTSMCITITIMLLILEIRHP
jgi:hypothetical protein